ncbi:MAG: amidophosphoribosyltransferase [Alphaproteobacteria bacterium RIFOXYD12_FULL_60_8]|nr:MAG: amidophosphoribosyltransferase [Alphaproteobacteria bacterium RIFOXYD12_FULL_60_8]
MNAALALGRRVARLALDALLPPQCLGCGELVDAPGALCPTCWEGIRFISQPCCARCGLPFELPDTEEGAPSLCAGCIAEPPDFDQARSVLLYDDASRGLILKFKHADRTEGAPAYARWLARAGAEMLAECDVIAPVPLHRWRLFLRRYNQAALLARHLGRLSGKPVAPDLLTRCRATPTQGGLDRRGRLGNVKGAFASPRPARVEGKTVLLIDDVFTTGATVGECAKALRRAGAERVFVLTLARGG